MRALECCVYSRNGISVGPPRHDGDNTIPGLDGDVYPLYWSLCVWYKYKYIRIPNAQIHSRPCLSIILCFGLKSRRFAVIHVKYVGL